MHKAILSLLAWLAIGIFAASSPSAQDQPLSAPERIVVVGDLHGDFEAWQAIARAADLIDDGGKWSGGATTLVQMGDVTDRGPGSLKIIRHLQELGNGAERVGGQVIVLLGNHEAMNVTGDLRYVHPGEYEAFRDRRSKRRRELTWRANQQRIEAEYAALDPPVAAEEAKERWFAATPLGKLEHRREWRPGGELAQWAAGLPVVVKLGRTLFAHGGLSAETAREPLETINARISYALSDAEDADRSVLEDPLGPLWYRGNVLRGEGDARRPSIEDELGAVLGFYDADRLVVAHTPSLEGILASQEGRVIRVDTGISAHYGGTPSYLELRADRAIAFRQEQDGSWVSQDLPFEQGEEK